MARLALPRTTRAEPPAAASASSPACLAISRNPVTGGLDGDPATTRGLLAAISNLGTVKTDGIDLGVNYRTPLVDGVKLALAFQGNWSKSSKFQAAPGLLNRECIGFYSVNCGGAASAVAGGSGSLQPELTWNTRATLTFADNIDVSVLWRHIDGVRQEPDDVANGNGSAFAGSLTGGALAGRNVDFTRIPSFDYFDLATRIGVAENFDLTITVSNLLDKQPPLVGSTVGSTSFNSGNTYPSTYDALGRRFSVGARLHF